MTKPIDDMTVDELRSALRWQTRETERLSKRLINYRDTVLNAVDNIRRAS